MTLALILIAIFIIVAVAVFFLLSPSSVQGAEPDNAKPTNFEVSTTTEDRLITEVFGTFKVALNLLHIGAVEREEIIVEQEVPSGGKGGTETVEQVVGHAVFVPLLYGISGFGGLSPLTATAANVLTGFYFNDELVAEFVLDDNDTASVKTGKSADLNGSGNSRSTLRFRDGSQTSFPQYASALGGDIPYFGTSAILFERAFVGDNAQSVPNYAVRVQTLHNFVDPDGPSRWAIYDAGSDTYGQNPADLLWYILRVYLEIPEVQFDQPSFLAAQTTLSEEGLGFYGAFEEPSSASEMIQEVLRHIDGVLNVSEATGLWTLSLVRDDYDIEDLPALGLNDYADVTLERQGAEDIPTQLELKHLDLDRWELTSVLTENPGARFAAGATKKKSLSFPFFASEAAVTATNKRIQRRYWKPLATVSFSVPGSLRHPTTGDPWTLNQGDVLKLSYDDPNGAISFEDLVVRVVGVGQGENEAKRRIDAVEDVFSAGALDLTGNPDASGSASSPSILSDAPSAVFVADASPEFSRSAAFGVLAAPPATGLADKFRVKIENRYSYGPFAMPAAAELAADFGADGSFGGIALEVALENPTDNLEEFTNTPGAWQRLARPAVLEHPSGDYEIISAKELIDNGGGAWTLRGYLRDVGGTGLALDGSGLKTFPAGSRVWFLAARTGLPVVPVGGALAVEKAVAVSAANFFDDSPPLSASATYGFRYETPYPPTRLSREGIAGPGWRISWVPRTRHAGATGVNPDNIPAFDADPEGAWEVSIPADSSFEPLFVSVPYFEVALELGPTKVYQIRSFLNGRFSEGREITVPGLAGL